MKKTILTLTALLLSPLAFSGTAHASDYCREFTRDIYVGAQRVHGYGKACQQPDGSWQIVSSTPGVDPDLIMPPEMQSVTTTRYYTAYSEPPVQNVVVVPQRYYYPRPYVTSYYFGFGGNHGNWGNHRGWNNRDHDDHHGWNHSHH